MNPSSNLLVALLASSIVALAFSVATQWKLAIQRESDLEAARLISRQVVAALKEAQLRNQESAPAPASAAAAVPVVPAATTTSPVEPNPPQPITQETTQLAAADVRPPGEPVKTMPQARSSGLASGASVANRVPPGPRTVEAEKPAEGAPPVAPNAEDDARRRPEVLASVPAAVERPPVMAQLQREELAKWHQLRRGMSRAAVHALLGEPKWRDRSLNTEFWLYSEDTILGRGWVAFYDASGPVFSWREP